MDSKEKGVWLWTGFEGQMAGFFFENYYEE